MEEQAFIYNNGQQIFINEENYLDNKWIPFKDIMHSIFSTNMEIPAKVSQRSGKVSQFFFGIEAL